jgi:hypothetical protein
MAHSLYLKLVLPRNIKTAPETKAHYAMKAYVTDSFLFEGYTEFYFKYLQRPLSF